MRRGTGEPLPPSLRAALSERLGAPIGAARGVNGGCINEAALIQVSGQTLFVKWNASPLPGLFEREARGLNALRSPGVIKVPEPMCWAEASGQRPGYLVMEAIEGPGESFDRDRFGRHFGEALAALHHIKADAYGLDHPNYIGALEQDNTAEARWIEFFAVRRLGAQRDLAQRQGRLRPRQIEKIDRLIEALPQWLPDDPGPSLLHGDLWSGNYMMGPDAQPVLIDPAVYHGHWEAELAFTELFGGFPMSFYEAYRANMPQQGGVEERKALYNTYPLLVHVNLFGGGYVRQLMSVVDRYL